MTTPPIEGIGVPAAVRNGTADDKALYATTLQFESVLTEELTKELDPSNDDSGADSSGDGTTAGYSQMLPGALAQSVTDSGGLGLANQLFLSLKRSSS